MLFWSPKLKYEIAKPVMRQHQCLRPAIKVRQGIISESWYNNSDIWSSSVVIWKRTLVFFFFLLLNILRDRCWCIAGSCCFPGASVQCSARHFFYHDNVRSVSCPKPSYTPAQRTRLQWITGHLRNGNWLRKRQKSIWLRNYSQVGTCIYYLLILIITDAELDGSYPVLLQRVGMP